MALPKRRWSRARTRNRRCHFTARALSTAKCAHCGATVLAHSACPKCGFYRGEKVDHTIKEKEEK